MSVVGSEGQHPFAKVNVNRSTSPLAQIMSPLENWSAVYSVTLNSEAAVTFVLSGDASYITGSGISVVDGHLGI